MVAKKSGEVHHRKDFGGGNYSDRLVLPKDGVDFKVTRFHGEAGAEFQDLQDPWDETVFVISGRIEVAAFFGETVVLEAGSVYVIPAGNVRSLKVLPLPFGCLEVGFFRNIFVKINFVNS